MNRHSCRICIEEDDIGNLISPCECKGSVKYIHEWCLKTWLLSENLSSLKCEICKTDYSMKLSYSTCCSFKLNRLPEYFCLSLFAIVIISLIAITCTLSYKQIDDPGTIHERELYNSLIALCIITLVVILLIFWIAIRQENTVRYIKEWEIFNSNYKPSCKDIQASKFVHANYQVKCIIKERFK